ncbi:MAG: tRNA (adenosine(37)-N6)-threonylcarbamoyltransferase complex dimerization subunit type 1 TsaB [Acidimicrobiia bacterium]|nr:tRNA (adenosine(37)-N6)-threonylcarbamoyltransferase complex dimerization subunit type 1 TsaB [Acidimicrobiia bacterium]
MGRPGCKGASAQSTGCSHIAGPCRGSYHHHRATGYVAKSVPTGSHMKILAIETSTPGSSVALSDETEIVATASHTDRRGHSSFLVPAMEFCFDQAGWNPDVIDAVAVDVGPGLYTGIRVGLATAQGIAAALGVPVIPGTSLDLIAWDAKTGRRHIWSVVDVRRGQVAVASYVPVPGGVIRDAAPELITPNELKGLLESDRAEILLVGDIGALGDHLVTGMSRVKVGGPRYPSASVLALVGLGKLERDELPAATDIRPRYLRDADVTMNRDLSVESGPWDRVL